MDGSYKIRTFWIVFKGVNTAVSMVTETPITRAVSVMMSAGVGTPLSNPIGRGA